MQTLTKFKQSVEDHQYAKDDLLKVVRLLCNKYGSAVVSQKMGLHKSYINNTLKRNFISDENLIAIAETLEEMSDDSKS